MRYRGCEINAAQVTQIRQMMAEQPGLSRWKLSRKLCEAWEWKQANGALRDMVCRGLLLALERAGAIELPPARRTVRNYLVERLRPAPVVADERPVTGPLSQLRAALEMQQVRRPPEEGLFHSLVEQLHYLGYRQPVGEHWE